MNDFVVLILVGLAMLVKWLIQRTGNPESDEENPGSGRAEPPSPQRRSPPLNAPEDEEERIRRFMEALGLPPGSVPPERPQRRPAPPPLQTQTAKAEETIPQQRPKPKRVQWPQRPPPDRRPIAPPSEPLPESTSIPKAASMGEAAPQMEVASIPEMGFATPESYIRQAKPTGTEPTPISPVPALVSGGVPLRVQLHDRGALRKALIMREILGAPKALQSAQSPSIFSPL